MRTGANILWFILIGWLNGTAWFLAGALMAITIIGLPWAKACIEIGKLSYAPFGREVVSYSELSGESATGMKVFRFLANLLWLPLGAFLALLNILSGCAFFVSIIGVPFGFQAFKLAGISLFPVGKRVVSLELAREARKQNAKTQLAGYRAK